jgi:hydroxyethylthiazole kinase-like uncharacterized protein yjeF
MKIFNVQQIRACDNFTIETEPIASIDLMERAAGACTNYIIKKLPLESDFVIFCGKGNNGGDGLAIARQLLSRNFSVRVLVVNHSQNESADFKVNSDRLILQFPGSLEVINKEADLASILFHQSSIVIDALLGTGVNKPAEGILASAINFINEKKKYVVSIDMPSGLYADSANDKNDPIIRASITLTFQFPKFSFLMPQNQNYVPVFSVLDIGLSKKFIDAESTRNYFITKTDLQPLLKGRAKFSQKEVMVMRF